MKKLMAVLLGVVPAPTEEQIVVFNKVIGSKKCERCHSTFNGRAWLSFTMHLINDHGVDSNVAYEITSDLAKRFVIKYGRKAA